MQSVSTRPHARYTLQDLEVDSGARDRLCALHARIQARLPKIADRVLDIALPGLAGDLEYDRFRDLLVEWLRSGLIGPFDDSFSAIRARVGRKFSEAAQLQGAAFAALMVIRAEYRARIVCLYNTEEAWNVLDAVDRLLDVELSMMLRYYGQRERRMRPPQDAVAERLHALRTLTAGLAHEVRNPLNSAKLQLEVLERRLRRQLHDARLYEPSELAKTEIEKLSDLLDELLTFANPSSLDLRLHDLVGIAREALESSRAEAESRNIEVALAGVPYVEAEVDANKVRTLLRHLIMNALEAIERDGAIRVTIREHADRVQIEVIDDGPGIPSEIRPRIYEPFFSTRSSTGLGMSIVHSMVALHGGTIEIDSEPGSTAIAVWLPRRAR